MTYEQIVKLAQQYDLSKEEAENFAMSMLLQGGDKNQLFIKNALQIKIKNK